MINSRLEFKRGNYLGIIARQKSTDKDFYLKVIFNLLLYVA